MISERDLEPILQAQGLCKSFGPIQALASADFQILPGEIHAVLGENGAGKSTLCRILCGYYRPDRGRILLGTKPASFSSPGDALKRGIALLEQDVQWVSRFTVLENLCLGMEPRRAGVFLDRRAAERLWAEDVARLGLDSDLSRLATDLTVAERQMVGLAKLMASRPEILFLDEPTSVLSCEQISTLFSVMREFKQTGKSVVFITHRLPEVFEIADRATVLRRGQPCQVRTLRDASEAELVELMLGEGMQKNRAMNRGLEHSLSSDSEGRVREGWPGASALALIDLIADPSPGSSGLQGLSLTVRAGEIVGVVGAPGNGGEDLTRILLGLESPKSGRIEILGRKHAKIDPASLRAQGVRWIPEDRLREAMIAESPLWENMLLGGMASERPGSVRWARPSSLMDKARRAMEEWDVSAQTPQDEVRALSGGNQQRVLLARELEGSPRLLLAFSPTRGVDVRTAASIRERLHGLSESSGAILLLSQDIEEVMSISNRVFVLYRGRATAARQGASADEIVSLMGGIGGASPEA